METKQDYKSETSALVVWQQNGAEVETPREQLEQLGEAIAELSAHIDAATFRLLRMISEFDRQDGWAEGFRSCAHWLCWRVGWGLGTARERVRVARALDGLPLLSEALRQGQISYSKVRAATRVARPDNEQELLTMAKDGTASHLERLVRYYRRYVGDEEQEQAQQQLRKQYLQTYTDDDGMLVIRGRLPPEVGARLQQALEVAADALQQQRRSAEREEEDHGHAGAASDGCSCGGEVMATSEDLGRSLRVEALGLVAESALAADLMDGENGKASRSPAPRNLLVVHVDAAVLADRQQEGHSHVEQGPNVSAETSRRLACDAQVVEVMEDRQGNVLDVGRRTRKIGPRMALALRQRDGTCQFPGCCRTRHLEAHHIQHWASGGKTNLDNMTLTCKFHHTLLHEGGFSVEGPGHAPRFRDPQGQLIEPSPRPARVSDDVVASLVACNRREGLAITPESNRITWAGEPIECGLQNSPGYA